MLASRKVPIITKSKLRIQKLPEKHIVSKGPGTGGENRSMHGIQWASTGVQLVFAPSPV